MAEENEITLGKDDSKLGSEESSKEKLEEKEIDNKIPYDRFKKVNDENKLLKDQLAKDEKDKTDAEKKRLEAEGNWQEAAELSDKKAKEADERADKAEKLRVDESKEYGIGIEAKNQGINDVNDAVKLIDYKDITINEDGSFSGIKEAIEKLKTDKPYLFTEGSGSLGVHSDKPKGSTIMTKEELLADPIAATVYKEKHPAEYDRIMGAT